MAFRYITTSSSLPVELFAYHPKCPGRDQRKGPLPHRQLPLGQRMVCGSLVDPAEHPAADKSNCQSVGSAGRRLELCRTAAEAVPWAADATEAAAIAREASAAVAVATRWGSDRAPGVVHIEAAVAGCPKGSFAACEEIAAEVSAAAPCEGAAAVAEAFAPCHPMA